jgi:hypothetical protein
MSELEQVALSHECDNSSRAYQNVAEWAHITYICAIDQKTQPALKLRHIIKSGYPEWWISWFISISPGKLPNTTTYTGVSFTIQERHWRILMTPFQSSSPHSWQVSTPLYSKGTSFKYRQRHLLLWLRFGVVSQLSIHPAIFKRLNNSAKHPLYLVRPSVGQFVNSPAWNNLKAAKLFLRNFVIALYINIR